MSGRGLSILQVVTRWILLGAREQRRLLSHFFGGGDGGTELVKGGAWLPTWLWFQHPRSSAFILLPLGFAFATVWFAGWWPLRDSAAGDACTGNGESSLSFVFSRCFPPCCSWDGADPFTTCQPAISDPPPYLFPSLPGFLFPAALVLAPSIYSKQGSFWELWVFLWIS